MHRYVLGGDLSVENQTDEIKSAYASPVRNSGGIESYFDTFGSVFQGASSYSTNVIADAIIDKILYVLTPLFYRRREITLWRRPSVSKQTHKRTEARSQRFADILAIL